MKICPNCKYVWADEYEGQCVECGAPLGDVKGSTGGDLKFAWANQIQRGVRENALERQMKRGNYDNVHIEDSVLDVARNYVVVDHSKLRELENGSS